jgi:hypothetical protein
MKTTNEIITAIESRKATSAWTRGVKAYALELLAELPTNVNYGSLESLKADLLNGASDWRQYSYGGCSLVWNEDIARRLCTPSELRKTRCGDLRPNSHELWPDVQARALYQAWNLIECAACR